MTRRRLQIQLPLLLPDVPDEQDACVSRLNDLLRAQPGVHDVHVLRVGSQAALCLHYNPDELALRELETLAKAAGAGIMERYGHAVLPLRAIDSEDAAGRMEALMLAMPGVLAGRVNLAAQRAAVEFDRTATSVDKLRTELGRAGYIVDAPVQGATGAPPAEPAPISGPWYRRHKELAWSLTAGVFLVSAWAGQRWAGLDVVAATVLYALAYAFGSFDLLKHWTATLRKGRVSFDIDLLMLVAAAGAAVLGEWAEGAFLLFLFALAHALEHYAMGRARNAIKALGELTPATAIVLRNGSSLQVPVAEVKVGEVVLVRPGERIPVDGQIVSGYSAVNQAPITGESVPIEKASGDEVFAGTINGSGALQVTTTRSVGDRTLDRVIRLVEEAQTQKAPTQLFTEKFERIFVPVVLISDVILIVLPAAVGIWSWSESFYRGMALLVAASPCALALGTPAAVLAGIAQAARNGVLVKGGAHLENLGRLEAIAFDKTGTLTIGEPEVTDVIPATDVTADELLSVAAAVEDHSQHPLARAVVRRAATASLRLPAAGDLQSITGRGVRSSIAGEDVELGNLRLWQDAGTAVPSTIVQNVEALQKEGKSTIVVRHGARWLGVLGVADQPRTGVRIILQKLREQGIRNLVMLTGDNRGVGEAIAREVGVSEVQAELLPENKVTVLRQLLAKHGQVAMIGDGVNDAPALAHATVGIAMGGAGTAVALETADVALMADDLTKLPFAVGLSRKASTIIKQNLYLSLSVIAVLIVATTTGASGIGLAVLVHEGSTLLVIGNALRLLGFNHE